MTKKSFFITAGALAALIPVAAFANFTVGDTMPTDEAQIRAEFEAKGYTVLEIEAEDGEIEVEYELDGQVYEVSIAADTGAITEVELEDDEDDEDDDD